MLSLKCNKNLFEKRVEFYTQDLAYRVDFCIMVNSLIQSPSVVIRPGLFYPGEMRVHFLLKNTLINVFINHYYFFF